MGGKRLLIFPCHTCLSTGASRRIEETGRLWQKFLDDFLRFESWLSESERTAALPNSSGVLYTVAKEELKKFEVRKPWPRLEGGGRRSVESFHRDAGGKVPTGLIFN